MFAALRSALAALSPKQQRVREEAFLGYHQRKHERAKQIAAQKQKFASYLDKYLDNLWFNALSKEH